VDKPLFGMYRAKVVDNRDIEKFGRVLVWIPDFMPLVDDSKGIWARPANNPIGGRNLEGDDENYYTGSNFIPKKGSWVFVFFECGNINRPYYFGSLDLENTKVLPENQLGSNYEDKWTIFKSHDGRCVVVSDDPDDERVEITGKKRLMTEPPSGDTNSVYQIDDNQTTILFDEREGREKILIRTRKGDFFHIDVDEQELQAYFESDIQIKTKGSFLLLAEKDVNIKSKEKMFIESEQDMNVKSGVNLNVESVADLNIKSGTNSNLESATDTNIKAGASINTDGAVRYDQSGKATGAGSAESAIDADPEGNRDT
jgi:hypothetical protein